MSQDVSLLGLEGIPEVNPGDDLTVLLGQALISNRLALQPGDVLVIAQKIVSKSENRYVNLKDVAVNDEALTLAQETSKDPRIVQLILDESNAVIRKRTGLVIVEHRLGLIHANAGIDQSNLPPSQHERVLLLPEDPDRSASQIRTRLQKKNAGPLAVIINDSAGRAWRNGTSSIALGTAGMQPVRNQIGQLDLHGRKLESTEIAIADELANAASLLMGQAAEACPVVLIRGASWDPAEVGSASLIRHPESDLFR